jgi:hypothetical protein
MAVSVEDLTNQSSFVFEGAVRRMGAITTSGIHATPEMAVVHITRVLKGPAVLSGFNGQEITVQLHRHEGVHEGLRAVFFTNGLHYGEGLVVREVGRLDARGPALEREVHDAMERASDEQFFQRLEKAEIVVSGEAVETRPYEPFHRADRPVSEHDPDFWECIIKVETVEKGEVKEEGRTKEKVKARHVVTLFAHSFDIRWYQSPKFEKGSTGIWLLQRFELNGEPVPELVTVHVLDFQPLSQLERIRALLRRTER